MRIFHFILAGLLFVAWFANLMMNGLYTGLYAMLAFIGAGLMLGMGAIVGQLQKIAANQVPPQA